MVYLLSFSNYLTFYYDVYILDQKYNLISRQQRSFLDQHTELCMYLKQNNVLSSQLGTINFPNLINSHQT